MNDPPLKLIGNNISSLLPRCKNSLLVTMIGGSIKLMPKVLRIIMFSLKNNMIEVKVPVAEEGPMEAIPIVLNTREIPIG